MVQHLAACTAALLVALVPTLAQAQTLVTARGAAVSVIEVQAAAEGVDPVARSATFSRPENVKRQAEDLLVRRLLAAEAEREGLDKEPLIAAQLTLIRERLLSDLRLARVEKAAVPDPAALASYAKERFQAAPDAFRQTERVRIRHLLVRYDAQCKASARAQDLLQRLKNGADFAELAKVSSEDETNAKAGGDLGWLEPKALGTEFERVIQSLKLPGEISDVVESPAGFHIFKLDERKPAGRLTAEEARPAIEAELIGKRRTEVRKGLIDPLLPDFQPDLAAMEQLAQKFAAP